MAKTKKKFPTRLTPDWRDKFDPEVHLAYFQDQEEMERVAELHVRLQEMYDARENNCFWGEDGGAFTSWTEKWDHSVKLATGWHEADDEDDPRPNLKSPFVMSAVSTTMAEMYEQNIRMTVKPWRNKAYKKAPAIENIINYPWERYGYSRQALEAMHESLECGSAWLHGDYKVIEKEVKIRPLNASGLKDLTKKEKQKIKDGKTIWRPETQVIFNDYTVEHVPLTEVYVDPAARNVHGLSYAANDIIRERRLSFEQFLTEYGTNPDYQNLDKVHIGLDVEKIHPFFKFPRGAEDSKFVIVREWERVLEDELRITANGVLITPEDYPLKFNKHKKLSYFLLSPMSRPHQLYGVGLADILEGIQVEDEVMRNSFLELLELSLNPTIITNNVVHGEFVEQYERAAGGGIVSITGDPSQIRWMEAPVSRLAEFLSMRAQLREDAIMVSLIDPKASALPTQSPTAFEASAMTQATMKAFMMTLKHFAAGMKPLGGMIWEMQKEQYPLQYKSEDIEARKGNATDSLKVKRKQQKSREMLLDGIKIEEDKTGRLVSKKRPGKKFKFVVKDKFFDMSIDDMDVIMDTEPMKPFSKITQARQAQENLSQFVPLYQNGLDKHPKIKLLMKEIVYAQGSNPELLGDDTEDDEDAIKRALDQQKVLQRNARMGKSHESFEAIPGIPGEPWSHTGEHIQRMVVLKALMETEGAKVDAFMEEQQKVLDTTAAVGGMPGQPPQMTPPDDILDSQIRMSNYQSEFEELARHTQVDQMSEHEAGAMAVQSLIGQAGPAQPQGGGASPVPQPSGQPSAGNVSMGGPGDNTGIVPMPAMQQSGVI